MASRAKSPLPKPNRQVLDAIDRSRLSLTQIKRRTGISSATIANWQAGRYQPSPSSVKMILRWSWPSFWLETSGTCWQPALPSFAARRG